jgi:hypothetical protein
LLSPCCRSALEGAGAPERSTSLFVRPPLSGEAGNSPNQNNAEPATFASAAAALSTADTNPFEFLLGFRASEPLQKSIQLHPGILAVASMIAYGGDSPGIEPDELELLLRSAVYLDRLARNS